jgi:hypothetical protein
MYLFAIRGTCFEAIYFDLTGKKNKLGIYDKDKNNKME